LPIWSSQERTLLTLIDTPRLPPARKAALQDELTQVQSRAAQDSRGQTMISDPGDRTQQTDGEGVSPQTAATLREAMNRLLSGRPQRTDGRLVKDNPWKEAGVSRATMNRAHRRIYPHARRWRRRGCGGGWR
jgi:hypothetical protein